MTINNIYKVQYFIRREIKRGRNANTFEDIENGEEIVIDNLEYAKAIYNDYKGKVQFGCQYSGYFGRAELFIPHIHENGMLAYWPDDEKYIEQYIVERN